MTVADNLAEPDSMIISLCVGIQDYLALEGDLSYGLGETEKVVPVKLLELGELSSLLDEKQVKQFVMELSNPRQGAKLGVYPTTTVTILDEPGELPLMSFRGSSQLRAAVAQQVEQG